MVGASWRLLFLLTNPISLRHHRPFALFRLPRGRSLTLSAAPNHLVHLSRRNSLIPIKFAQNFYSRATNNAFQENNHTAANEYHVSPPHPWPEWSRLLESLSVAGYFNGDRNIEDEFMANENLSMEFVAAANSCLAFARDRPDILGWLPRKDIQVLIDDGYPFLFKSAHESERRMRSFLQGSNEATSVDLMKYILSCASNPVVYPERNIKEATESSVRSLLQEMANLSYRGRASEQFESVVRDEQLPRNLGPNITMKRGDWICPKCSFMNFARNTKCLECEELRQQRQLTDGEWDCPQCNFFNYRRNVVCLKCECRRPGEAPSPGPANTPSERQMIGSHYRNNYDDNGGNKFRVANKNLETLVEHDQDQFHGNSFDRHQNDRNHGRPPIAMRGLSGYVPFVPLPADMFAKKPEKTTNEHSEAVAGRSSESPKTDRDSQCSEKSATYIQSRYSQDIDKEEKTERWFKKVKELHGVTGPTSAVSHDNFPPIRKGENHFIDSKKKDQPLSPWAMEQGSSSSSSFVPFPPDHFAKKGEQQQPSHSQVNENLVQGMGNQHMHSTNNNLDSRSSIGTDSSNDQLRGNETLNVRSGWTGKSLEGSAVTETDPLDMSEEAKAERWFRRVAQIKDISELSQIPDEDFPSIMPMRKGVNRFVVSKRKTPLERRLTSPQYRKNLRVMSSDPMKREGDDDN